MEQKDHKEHEFFRFLLEAPSKLIEADFKNRQYCFKNQRVHSTNK